MLWHTVTAAETAARLKTDFARGLSEKEAEKRLKEQGKNELKQKKGKGIIGRFFDQFSDFMVLVLLGSAAVSLVTSIIHGSADYTDPILILAIVVLNAILGVVQESRAERAIEALKKLAAPTARVLRGGRAQKIAADEVVVGDIVLLEAGDCVPADIRLVKAHNLKADESALTGESVAVEKDADTLFAPDTPLGDRKNMMFSSGIVAAGRGTGVVVATGMDTQMGRIASLLGEEKAPDTPLQQRLAKTGKALGLAALMICLGIFLMGVMRKTPPFEMFMTSVGLAVAAIPEGLPAVVTIMLALGVQRMARQNSIIRKMPAVETLGSATVICSDKTGTLTQNRMSVVETACGEEREMLRLAALCNNSAYDAGDPTERALVIAAHNAGQKKEELERIYPRVSEIPFESARKLMTTIHKKGDRYLIITKGAPDVLVGRCTHIKENGNKALMTQSRKAEILSKNTKMANNALRVLAVAYKEESAPPKGEGAEEGLTFAGLIGMIDPPRPEVPEAVRTCRRAGIRPVMITGDHAGTAAAIARQIGILSAGDEVITGNEIDSLSDDELMQRVGRCSVYARVSPRHKVRIIKALQMRGEVVAMTGDGVNDAPALKAADIGCAMGQSGTDVAKAAADMVLTDDNFATIVAAVREGRGIYANIKRTVHFLLSSNVGEIATILAALFLGWPSPLLAVHLLWVNFVTDSLPAIALGLEPPEKGVMDRKPIPKGESLFAGGLVSAIIFEGAMIGGLSLLAFAIGSTRFDIGVEPVVGRTMAFAVLSLAELVHSFNMQSEKSVFSAGVPVNPFLWGAFFLCSCLQVIVICVPAFARVFGVVALSLKQWGIVAALSMAPLVIIELEKALTKRQVRLGMARKRAVHT